MRLICLTIFFTIVSIIAVPFTLLKTTHGKNGFWELYRWHSIHWVEKTPQKIVFDLHLFPPKQFDHYRSMIFLKNVLSDIVDASCFGAVWVLEVKNLRKSFVRTKCFNTANLMISLLDFDLNDLFQNDVTVVKFDISYNETSYHH